MTLHSSQQTNLDYLIPQDLIEYCEFDQFNFGLSLTATSARNRWPTVKVWLDGKLIASDIVDNHGFEYRYSERLDMSLSAKVLEIEYNGKNDEDTVVDQHGNILENQSLSIRSLIVNRVDIINNDIIQQLGSYTRSFSPEKLKYYEQNNLSTEPTDSLDMYENGRWRMTFPIPIVTNLSKIKNKIDPQVQWPDPILIGEIVNTIHAIRDLEKQLKERK
jgi:hypothetical protein